MKKTIRTNNTVTFNNAYGTTVNFTIENNLIKIQERSPFEKTVVAIKADRELLNWLNGNIILLTGKNIGANDDPKYSFDFCETRKIVARSKTIKRGKSSEADNKDIDESYELRIHHMGTFTCLQIIRFVKSETEQRADIIMGLALRYQTVHDIQTIIDEVLFSTF